MSFGEGKNLIICPRPPESLAQADFSALTAALIKRTNLLEHDQIELNDRDLELAKDGLSEGERIAADIILSDRFYLKSRLGHSDTIETKLQGVSFDNDTSIPHIDAARVAFVRYAGPRSREFNNNSVMGRTDVLEVALKDNPEFFDVEHGHLMVHQGSGFLNIRRTGHFPFFERVNGAAHAKGKPNGEPGLITVAQYL
jgi:hypothetical protein